MFCLNFWSTCIETCILYILSKNCSTKITREGSPLALFFDVNGEDQNKNFSRFFSKFLCLFQKKSKKAEYLGNG